MIKISHVIMMIMKLANPELFYKRFIVADQSYLKASNRSINYPLTVGINYHTFRLLLSAIVNSALVVSSRYRLESVLNY